MASIEKFSCSLKYVLAPLQVKIIAHKSLHFTLLCEINKARHRLARNPIAPHLTGGYDCNVCNGLPLTH
jgi:hypothetical protein